MVPVSRETAEIQKMENSGNEAKKYLKTKDIAFLNVASFAHFARNFAPFGPQKEQETPHFWRTMRNLRIVERGLDSDT